MVRNNFKLVLFFVTSIFLASCGSAPSLPYYKKSPTRNSFDYHSDAPFSRYVAITKAYLKKNRVFFDSANQEEELEMVAPFEWKPDESCSTENKQGILLVHGLSDTAFIMRDLAKEFHDQCMLVRTILLPGHGTRPKDLAEIKYSDWTEAVDYGINSLQKDVDQIYIAGFSLGGLLAANALLDHQDLQGAILISPALGIKAPLLTWNTTWLRHFKEWIDVDPQTQAPRYQSMTTNGIAQVYMLTQNFHERLKNQKKVKSPVLLIQSMEDIAIQPDLNINTFKKHMSHSKSMALVFSEDVASVKSFAGLNLINSYLPSQKIVNFSHVSLPYSPKNKVYGLYGSYKECGLHVGIVSDKQAEDCVKSDDNWMGEIGSEDEDKFYPFQRLTFNPLFDLMADKIDRYLSAL